MAGTVVAAGVCLGATAGFCTVGVGVERTVDATRNTAATKPTRTIPTHTS